MDKKLKGWMNAALGSVIVALGFGSCRTSKPVAPLDGPTMTLYDTLKPVRQVEPPVCIYGPPEMLYKRQQEKAAPVDNDKKKEEN